MNVFLAFALAFPNLFPTMGARLAPFQGTTNQFVVASAASYVGYSSTTRIVGQNTLLSIYPTSGYLFPTTNGGTYTATSESIAACKPDEEGFWALADCALGGVVVFESFGNPSSLTPLGTILYASPTQINFFIPNRLVEQGGSEAYISLFKRGASGGYVFDASSTPEPMLFEANHAEPFVEYGTFGGVTDAFLKGTLYGISDGADGYPAGSAVPLKSLTDGAGNPREYKGQATLIQGYFTGVPYDGYNPNPLTGSVTKFRFVYDNQDGSPYIEVQSALTPYKESIGVYVCNLFKPWSGWGAAGVHDIKVGHGNLIIFTQTGVSSAKVWWI